MEASRKCEQCNSHEFEDRWQGASYQIRCSHCKWECATTRLPQIVTDAGPYSIIITSLGADHNRSLIALNRYFSHGISQTKSLFSQGERELFKGSALEVWNMVSELSLQAIPFRIEPDYSYLASTSDPLIGHEHDWLPVSK